MYSLGTFSFKIGIARLKLASYSHFKVNRLIKISIQKKRRAIIVAIKVNGKLCVNANIGPTPSVTIEDQIVRKTTVFSSSSCLCIKGL